MGHLKNQQRALRHRCKILEIKMLNFFLTFWGRNILDLFLKVVAELNDVQCICVYVKFCCSWSIDILVSVLSCYKFWIYNYWLGVISKFTTWHCLTSCKFCIKLHCSPIWQFSSPVFIIFDPIFKLTHGGNEFSWFKKAFLYQGFNWHSNKS